MQAFLAIAVISILAFIGFVIYFIFKQLEFVIRAINLYERMVSRQDTIIKLLVDIRGGADSLEKIAAESESDRDQIKLDLVAIEEQRKSEEQKKVDEKRSFQDNKIKFSSGKCPGCEEQIDKEFTHCLSCGFDFSDYQR